jgi:hypothetical protein
MPEPFEVDVDRRCNHPIDRLTSPDTVSFAAGESSLLQSLSPVANGFSRRYSAIAALTA